MFQAALLDSYHKAEVDNMVEVAEKELKRAKVEYVVNTRSNVTNAAYVQAILENAVCILHS